MEKVLLACIILCVAWFAVAYALAWVGGRFLKATPRRVTVTYAAVIVALGLAGTIRWWWAGIPVKGDFYNPYIVVGGPVVWFAVLLALEAMEMVFPQSLGPSMVLWNLVMPGAWFILLGGLQWYGLARLAARWGGKPRRAIKGTS